MSFGTQNMPSTRAARRIDAWTFASNLSGGWFTLASRTMVLAFPRRISRESSPTALPPARTATVSVCTPVRWRRGKWAARLRRKATAPVGERLSFWSFPSPLRTPRPRWQVPPQRCGLEQSLWLLGSPVRCSRPRRGRSRTGDPAPHPTALFRLAAAQTLFRHLNGEPLAATKVGLARTQQRDRLHPPDDLGNPQIGQARLKQPFAQIVAIDRDRRQQHDRLPFRGVRHPDHHDLGPLALLNLIYLNDLLFH